MKFATEYHIMFQMEQYVESFRYYNFNPNLSQGFIDMIKDVDLETFPYILISVCCSVFLCQNKNKHNFLMSDIFLCLTYYV